MPKQVSFNPTDESDLLDDAFPEDDDPATPQETREEFLDRARSGYTKVRHSFVQIAPTGKQSSRPAMLPHFSRNHRAAVLYLAVLANWPWLSRQNDPLPADAWIRFLTCDDSSALTWTPQSLSHAWGVLEGLNLITRPRKGRLKHVQPLREDGKGSSYSSPMGRDHDSYLILPNEFWTKQLHGTLSWPALAVLLILLKETGNKSVSPLSVDRAQDWYGISRTTTEQGLSELRELGLLDSRMRQVKDVNSTGGRRLTSEHRLLSNFSTTRRERLRKVAKTRIDQRSPSMGGSNGKEADDDDDKPSDSAAAS